MPNNTASAARRSLTRIIAAAVTSCCIISANVLPFAAHAQASAVEAMDAGELLLLRVSEALSLGTQETAKRLAKIGFSEQVEQLQTLDGYRLSSFSSRTLVESLYRRAELQSPGEGEGERFLAVLYRDAAKDSQAIAKAPEFAYLREYIRRYPGRLYLRTNPIRFAPPSELASDGERIALSPAAGRAIARIADIYSGPHLGRMRLLALQTFRNKFDNAAFERAIADARSTREAIELMVQRGTPPPTVERALLQILKRSAAKMAPASPEVLERMTRLDPKKYKDLSPRDYEDLNIDVSKTPAYPELLEEMIALAREDNNKRVILTTSIWEKATNAIEHPPKAPSIRDYTLDMPSYTHRMPDHTYDGLGFYPNERHDRHDLLGLDVKDPQEVARKLHDRRLSTRFTATELFEAIMSDIQQSKDLSKERRILDELWQTDWFRSITQLVQPSENWFERAGRDIKKLRQLVKGPAPDLSRPWLAESSLLSGIAAKLKDQKSRKLGLPVRPSELTRPPRPPKPPVAKRSDRRQKVSIGPIATSHQGLTLYRFRYRGDEQCWVGLIAQDLVSRPRYRHALIIDQDGYYRIDYASLGLRMATCEEWRVNSLEAVRAPE